MTQSKICIGHTFVLHHLIGDCNLLDKGPFTVVLGILVVILIDMVLHADIRKFFAQFPSGEMPLHVWVCFAPGDNLKLGTKSKL